MGTLFLGATFWCPLNCDFCSSDVTPDSSRQILTTA